MKTLRRKIMRGIYYAYAIRLVSLPGVWQGFLMLGTMIALTRFVSIADVLRNLSNVELGRLGAYLYDAARSTETGTLLLVGLFIFCLLSLRTTIMSQHTMRPYSLVRG